jgi:hypothetical protein
MFLIQLLLPLYSNDGQRSSREMFETVRRELVDRFGGLTAYTRAPAKGVWEEDTGERVRDEIVIYEVMADTLDEPWWRSYRAQLERRFHQESLVVRSQEIRIL